MKKFFVIFFFCTSVQAFETTGQNWSEWTGKGLPILWNTEETDPSRVAIITESLQKWALATQNTISFKQWTGGISISFVDFPPPQENQNRFGDTIITTNGNTIIHADIYLYTVPISAYGMNVKTVMLHEIGHALGMAHSEDSTAIMYPYATKATLPVLGSDDIAGIRSLYLFIPFDFDIYALEIAQVRKSVTFLVSGTFQAGTVINWSYPDQRKKTIGSRFIHRFKYPGLYEVDATVNGETRGVWIEIDKKR